MNEATTTTDSTAGKIVCTQCGRASNNASWLEGEGPFCGICAAIWRNRIWYAYQPPQVEYPPSQPRWLDELCRPFWQGDHHWYADPRGTRTGDVTWSGCNSVW